MPSAIIAAIFLRENVVVQYFLLFVRGLEQGGFGL
jgi:hypothetical protein